MVGRDYPRARRVHLILNNYRTDSSQQTKLALEQLGGRVVLHFLPPYCPDHHRIERVGRDLHANVTGNHRCQTMEELMHQVRTELQHRSRHLMHRYTNAA